MTVRDLIKGSLRLIGAIAAGETPSADETADGLTSLNGMLASWSINGLLINGVTREVFPLTAGQQSYTMGNGGNFNSVRPTRILEASILDNSNEYPVDIINIQEWASISTKNMQSQLSQRLYYEGTSPLETINLWPIPAVSNSLVLYSLKPIGNFADVDDEMTLPEGYERAIKYNLALELAPEYGRDPSAIVAMTAIDSKADLQRQNTQPIYMTSDAIGITNRKPFNWMTGD